MQKAQETRRARKMGLDYALLSLPIQARPGRLLTRRRAKRMSKNFHPIRPKTYVSGHSNRVRWPATYRSQSVGNWFTLFRAQESRFLAQPLCYHRGSSSRIPPCICNAELTGGRDCRGTRLSCSTCRSSGSPPGMPLLSRGPRKLEDNLLRILLAYAFGFPNTAWSRKHRLMTIETSSLLRRVGRRARRRVRP